MAKVSINAYYHTALDLHKSGKLREARKLYADILKVKPNHLESLFMTGQSWYQENKFDEALSYFNRGLEYRAGNIDFLLQKGKTLIKLSRFDEAKLLFDQLVNSNKDNPQILFHSARNLKEIGQLEAAIKSYERVLDIDPSHIQALNNLGNLYQQIYDYDKALVCYDKLIELDNQVAMAYCNKAGLFQKMGKLDEAESYYHQALRLDAFNALAMYNLGVISNRRYNHEEALQWIQKSIKRSPENHKYLSTYATTLSSLGKQEEAIKILQKLVESGVKSEEPYLRLARIFISNQENSRAIELLQPYVLTNSYCYEGMYLLGVLYDLEQELEKAEEYLIRVVDHPEFALKANMALQLIYSKLGRMDKYDEMMAKVTGHLQQFIQGDRLEDEIPIYNLAYYPFDYELVTSATKKFSDSLIRSVSPLRDRLGFRYPLDADKIKIGYLSPYFKKHPAGALIQGVLRHHDKEKFEVYGYAINCGNDEINQETRLSVDHYVALDGLTSAEAAQRINRDGIHILVSLAGYNYGMKSEIPALKPAPIQVVCMDCHETMQTDFYDYIFKDEVVLTAENRQHFNESIAYLPPSHFFNTELMPSDKKVSRRDYGLPEDAFVFGCLNHPRKISPIVIRCWVQILRQTSDSVLWLFHGGIQQFQENIHQIFSEEGIDPDRIIFCGRESQKDHIRRMELIDLFLDTPVYNGHTTCLEALWMDIPVLTLRGATVSSRLCSSFLQALSLTGLICESEERYIRKAVELTGDKTRIDELKHHLKSQKKENDFFNPQALTEKLERAYKTMWEVHESEKKPSDFTIN